MLNPISKPRYELNEDKMVTFDIEASDWTTPVALGMYDHASDFYRVWTGRDCVEKFVTEMLRRKWRNYTFYAHNGGRYDFTPVLLELLERDEIETQILTRNNKPFYVKVVKADNDRVHLLDSFALMPMSLKAAAEAYADTVTKDDYDVANIPEWEAPDSEWTGAQDREKLLEYLRSDCVALSEALLGFTAEVRNFTDGVMGPSLTMGSTTMSVYRSRYQKDPLMPDRRAEGAFRAAYYGGRTEVFGREASPEDGPFRQYDVNSLYPYVYTRKPMPTGPPFPWVSDDMSDVLDMDEYLGVVYLDGYVPEDGACGIPVLPVRESVDDGSGSKVVFKAGKISGWFMLSEVRYALEVGALEDVTIHRAWLSSVGAPFREYGEHLYSLKQSIDKGAEPGRYVLVKLLLNSFYGKFGMKREQSSVKFIDPSDPDAFLNNEYSEITDELTARGVVKERAEAQSAYIIPRFAAEITSAARIEMHKWLMKAVEKGGRVWYCDTDSLVTNVELPTGPSLGELEPETKDGAEVIEHGVFVAPKTYALKFDTGVVKVKGKGLHRKSFDPDFSAFTGALESGDPSNLRATWQRPAGFSDTLKKGEWDKVKERRSVRNFDSKRNHDSESAACYSAPLTYPLERDELDTELPEVYLMPQQR